jgi:myosin I
VQYLGLLDNIKVRRAGFAYRATYEKFLNRYALLSKQTSYAGKITFTGQPLEGCRKILQDLQLDQRQFQIGRTKIFLKDPETLFSLEDLRERYWYNMAARITNAYRVANSFQHTAATRVKNAFLTYKYYRQLCAIEIQRAYREFKKVQPHHDARMRFEAQLGAASQKSRQRFSLGFYRKFFGDYMKIQQQQQLMQAMALKNPAVNGERPIFSFPGESIIVPGIFGSPKISPRYIVLTQNMLYTIAGIQKKGQTQFKCERAIAVANITGATFSTLGDNMVVVHAQKPDWDVVLQLPLKTELAAQIHALKNGAFQIAYNDLIEWRKKKSSKGKLKFVRQDQFPAPKGMFKKYQMSVGGAQPPGSRMTMPQMYDAGTIVNQVQHLREAAVIITDDMLRAAGKRDRGARGEDGGGGGGGGGGAAAAPAAAGGRGGGGRGGGAAPAGRGGGRGGGGGPQGKPCTALWDYQGAAADELSFKAGQVLVATKMDGDWWTGYIQGNPGKIGLFPVSQRRFGFFSDLVLLREITCKRRCENNRSRSEQPVSLRQTSEVGER